MNRLDMTLKQLDEVLDLKLDLNFIDSAASIAATNKIVALTNLIEVLYKTNNEG